MKLSEYNPKPYLLIELPYSKVIMDHPEAIQLEKPVGAFIVPQAVWRSISSKYTIDQMKLSGELTSTIAADGTEWLDCPNAIPSVRTKVITTSRNGQVQSNQHPRVDAWNTMRDDGLIIARHK